MKMFDMFRDLLVFGDDIGNVESAHMYNDNYCSVEGLDREGNYYITDNKAQKPMHVRKRNDETIIATSPGNIRSISFKVGTRLVDQERQVSIPIFDMIKIEDSIDKSTLEVCRPTSEKTPKSYVEIKLNKNFNGSDFSVNVDLFSDGTINVSFDGKQTASFSLNSNTNYSSNEAKKVLADLELSDEKMLPIIEYYANNYPIIARTYSKVKGISSKPEPRTKILTIGIRMPSSSRRTA
jgi:hypothetical protein